MQKKEDVSPDFFISFFRPTIRVKFNWRRMTKERWPIALTVLKKSTNFSKWYFPWYLGTHGKEVKYSASNAIPVSLSSISSVLSNLKKKRQKTILQLEKNFISSPYPTQLVVPRYALGNSQYLLLDSSHRMAALIKSHAPFILLVFTVLGPLDEEAIPDLRHWN